MDERTTVEGLGDVFNQMDSLPPRVQKSVMRPALSAAGQVFEAAIASTVPRLTGELAQSITRKVSVKGNSGGVVLAGPAYMGGHKHTSTDPGVRGAFLEFGTRKMAPQPFMRRAFDMAKNQAYDAAVAVMKTILAQLPKG